MLHQNKGRKLNCTPGHRKSLLRNQAIHLILYGKLCTTLARVKEVRSFVEKVVTIARKGTHFNNWRKVYQILPYNLKALEKLFTVIAPEYVNRPGGYTRIVRLHNRISDTAEMAQLMWVTNEQSILKVEEEKEKQEEKTITV